MHTYSDGTKADIPAAEGCARRLDSYALMALCMILLLGVSVYLFRAYLGLHLTEDGDEAHCLVAAQMIAAGNRLYKDIFIQHGPLPEMIAHLYAVAVSRTDFSYVRVAPILLTLASCVAVLLSPALKNWGARIFAVTLHLTLVSAIWFPRSLNLVLYPSIGGYCLAILLAQCIVPLYFREKLTFGNVVVGGASFALAGSAAYVFILPGLFFIISSIPNISMRSPELRTYLRGFLIGALGVVSGVAVWLWIFGDIPGYFIYHIYFNQEVYSKFIGDYYSHIWVFNNLSISMAPVRVVQTVAIALMGAWIFIFLRYRGGSESRPPRGIRVASVGLMVCGVLLANPSGDLIEDHNTAFLIPNFALFSLALAVLMPRNLGTSEKWKSGCAIVSAIVAVSTMELAGSFSEKWLVKTGVNETDARLSPQNGSIYQFVRSITQKEGGLLALEYNPVIYIRAGRLPAFRNFFYLPWQAAYNRSPFEGYTLDLCSDLSQRRPAVIWFLNWPWWNYAIETFEPCVVSHIVNDYAPLEFNSAWYVRKDILEKYIAPIPPDPEADALGKMSIQLTEKVGRGPIQLRMTPEHKRRTMPLRRLGILFASSPSEGDAELTLRGPGGVMFSTRFSFSDIKSNRYYYFDVRPNIYATGEIQSSYNSDIRLWSAHLLPSNECMIYEYIDSSRGYTPACPIADPFLRNSAQSGEPRSLAATSASSSMAH